MLFPFNFCIVCEFSCSQSVINHGLCVNLQLILFETYL